MHTHDLSAWRHHHRFDAGNSAGERSTWRVMWLTLGMMVLEIVAGWAFQSMALLADGIHMSSHAVAIGLSAFAYAAARRHAGDPRYAFGTWKIEVLGGFASAVLLLGVAALMLVGSVERLWWPEAIHYPQAMAVAVLGLLVNLVSAAMLGAAHHGHGHGHEHHQHHGHDDAHDHAHDHAHHHGHGHDLNLKSVYLHVVADAATSVAAILALAGGWWMGWAWLDPLMGILGAVLVAVWAKGLIAETSRVLLDREMDHPVVHEIREVIAARGAAGQAEIVDLHVWRVGKGAFSCALCLVTHDPQLNANDVRGWLAVHPEVVHSTIEIQRCVGA